MHWLKICATIAALAIAISTTTAAAQDQPLLQGSSPAWVGIWGPFGNVQPWAPRNHSPQAICTAIAGHIDARLAYIEVELKITKDQQPLWSTYEAAARRNAETIFSDCIAMLTPPSTAKVTLPARLDEHEGFMAIQLESERQMNKALKPLFAALSETQKQTAVQFFWGTMGAWGPRGAMGYGGMGPWMLGWDQSDETCAAIAGHIDARLAYIKTELKITADQQSLWDPYAAAARENSSTMLNHCRAMTDQRGASTISLPARLDEHEQFMAAQLDAVRARNKALKPLYASLSEGQKPAANQLFWWSMGMLW